MFGLPKTKQTEEVQKVKVRTTLETSEAMKSLLPKDLTNDDVYFICIGTDRSTGDSLGPLVGTKLKELGYTNVVGTLSDPVHAVNLEETVSSIPKGKYVIAIDACLGKSDSVQQIQLLNGPIQPGAGVNKELPPVGDFGIAGIVNVGGFMEYFVLQNTRLSIVMDMSEKIVAAIHNNLPLRTKRSLFK